MATTTTNFGWDIPQSTDLVKDGATAIAALGQDIDTAFIDLKGGTTGQVLAKASATDLDFSWVAQDDSNAIQNAIVDAKGDLISATANDTPARLAVGTDGQLLIADSTAATGLKWGTPASGGLTLLSTTTFSNTVTNFTVSSISGSYKNLLIVGSGLQTSAGSPGPTQLQFNADTGTNYTYSGIRNINGTIQADSDIAATNIQTGITYGVDTDTANRFGNFQMNIYNYASTSLYKAFNSQGGCRASAGQYTNTYSGNWTNNTNAITSIKFTNATGGNFKAGTIQIYGVA